MNEIGVVRDIKFFSDRSNIVSIYFEECYFVFSKPLGDISFDVVEVILTEEAPLAFLHIEIYKDVLILRLPIQLV